MIVFDLECSSGHLFEGWFSNIESFEDQNAEKLINCPYCNDTRIRRVLSPVTVKSPSPPAPQEQGTPIDYRKLAKELIHYINKNFEDVGTEFTKEALKMHYGVTEKRNIKGSATAEEEKTLKDEGIEVFKIPVIKTDDDKKN